MATISWRAKPNTTFRSGSLARFAQPEVYPDPPYLASVVDRGQIALVAVRTPPFGAVLSEPGVSVERILNAVALLVVED